ncbi:MAG TPA: DUF2225 domain-containing protein [Thermodesulfobium narugense]|nr:MAG: hypothetical protein C0174_03485 [Thermodesulfobium narugense]HEM56442.1 DUF2225 domain-containing protein [Thermodesulfobium narugense]
MFDKNKFFQTDLVCPVCKAKFKQLKLKTNAFRIKSRDIDMCNTYEGINPNLYSLVVCPECGYANLDHSFQNKLSDVVITLLQKELPKSKLYKIDVTGERDYARAIDAYEQAIYCANIAGHSASLLAGIYFRMTCLAKSFGSSDEDEYRKKAIEFYEKAYDHEEFPLGGKMSQTLVEYMIASMYFKLNRLEQAVYWLNFSFSRDPKGSTDPKAYSMIKELWMTVKNIIKNK